ncbi:hypothetical protein [Photobacterium chitinilyticum]|uniref:hypothetical protein n=1 Tax=Photobacterium chitinilyticum TaxID=2485123 RepID=UPI0013E8B531|nr:hypothetical protein [Photobacterium chitinilyticum]
MKHKRSRNHPVINCPQEYPLQLAITIRRRKTNVKTEGKIDTVTVLRLLEGEG